MFSIQRESYTDQDRKTKGTQVYLLGPLRIEQHQQPIRIPRRKVESLFVYLLLHPQHHTRNSLATLFWGDTSDEKARHSLRTSLAILRQTLGDSLLLSNREQVQINPDFPLRVDLCALLTWGQQITEIDLTNPSELRTMLALWQGELLAGFYDDWVLVARERYQTHLLTLFLTLTQALRTASEYTIAIEVAQKVLNFDPANEQAHQHLMFCYMATGERTAALRQYELCEEALERDLDASPSPETTALYHWIKRNDDEEASFAAKITNLPIPLTSFVGRTQQMREVKQLLNPTVGKTRLLTLTGAGGSGKTRLAIQVATDLIDSFSHGVWWVELATLNNSEQVARAVAKSLGVTEVTSKPFTESIVTFLGDKQMLLLLDNCEHLIEACVELVSELLSRCPNLQILTTSREALLTPGETLWQVPTLGIPDPQQLSLDDLLLEYECVRLFYERARSVQATFQLTLENAVVVVEICTRLDGLPLAIELAAARVKVLPVEEIATRLNSAIGARFDLLTQGGRSIQARQQTLRAAIDWSYNLLDEDERLLFRTLSVFRGGFTVEALEAISKSEKQNSQLATRNSLDLLTQLVDKSLVVVGQQGGQTRYHLLETLREYGLELWNSVEEMKALRQRHATFFLHFAEQAEPALVGPQQQAWLNRLETEHANLRAALTHFLADTNGELALRLSVALYRFWEIHGYFGEGREALRRSLLHCDSATYVTQARALNAAGFLAWRQSDYAQARSLLNEAHVLFAQAEEEIGIIEVLQNLAVVEQSLGSYAIAQQYLEQSLQLCSSLEHSAGIARTSLLLGLVAKDQGRTTESRDHCLESLRLYLRLGDQVGIATTLLNLGNAERGLGNLGAASNNLNESLVISRTLGDKDLLGRVLRSLAQLAVDQEQYTQARSFAEEALQILRDLGDRSNASYTLSVLGDLARKEGESRVALSYYCHNLQTMSELGYKWPIVSALEDIASLLTDIDQHPESTVYFLGAAQTIRKNIGVDPSFSEETSHRCCLTCLRHQLGETAFTTIWEEGGSAPLSQIVVQATRLTLG